MTDKPAISVLMSVYNTPIVYLREAVNSIRNQTFTDFELVLINDASTDEEVLEYIETLPHLDERIFLFHNEKNLGITKSLNVGLKKCRGELVARMDTDDIAPVYRLMKEKAYMDEHREIVLTGGRVLVFEDSASLTKEFTENKGSKRRTEDSEIHEIRSLLEHSGPAHPTFMYRRDFLLSNNIFYRENIRYAQDYGLMVDIMLKGGQIAIIPEVMLYYREHQGQITSTKLREQLAFQSEISADYIKRVCPKLSKKECEALSRIREDAYYYPPKTYLLAIKKFIKENKELKKYNQKKLKRELHYEWMRHVIRCGKSGKHPLWILHPFSVYSLKNYIIVRNEIKG